MNVTHSWRAFVTRYIIILIKTIFPININLKWFHFFHSMCCLFSKNNQSSCNISFYHCWFCHIKLSDKITDTNYFWRYFQKLHSLTNATEYVERDVKFVVGSIYSSIFANIPYFSTGAYIPMNPKFISVFLKFLPIRLTCHPMILPACVFVAQDTLRQP